MSKITHVMLMLNDEEPSGGTEEAPVYTQIDEVNEWLRERDLGELRRVPPEAAGGTKVWCEDIYYGAFNYLPENFVDFVNGLEWKSKNVQVLAKREFDEMW